ncbi:MAG: hypothetical protein U5N26_11295 [Candidatus Marinimicrobia bacterium]|nr:hypothetical protein [Candidatus Neomarinimicrobiota bacterium]
MLEQVIAFSGEEIRYDNLLDILGVIHEEVYFNIFRELSGGRADKVLMLLDDMLIHGYDLREFLSGFSVFLRDLYMVCAHGSADILNTTDNMKKAYAELAEKQDPRTLIRMLSIINSEMPNMVHPLNLKIMLETLFIKLSRLQDFTDLEKVLKKVKRNSPPGGNVTPPPEGRSRKRAAGTPPPARMQERNTQECHRNGEQNGGSGSRDTAAAAGSPLREKPAGADAENAAEAVKSPELGTIKEKWEEFIECIQPRKPAGRGPALPGRAFAHEERRACGRWPAMIIPLMRSAGARSLFTHA